MFGWLKRKPKEPKPLTAPREGAASFEVGGFWGDKIEWWKREDGQLTRVMGWKEVKPQIGDVLTCEMQSGKIGVWIFQKIEHCNNPRDMFFADVSPIGYSDQLTFTLPPPPRNIFAELRAQGTAR